MCSKWLKKLIAPVLLAIFLLVMLIPIPASALGLGISPSKLTITARPGGVVKETLYVMNTTQEESQFQIYTDEQYRDWIKIEPDQFILSPDANKTVEITASPPHLASGIHGMNVYIISTSPGSGFHLGAGIKVPTQINVEGFSISIILLFIETALIAFLSFLLIRRRTKYQRTAK
jgi:hypothetical protein